LWSRKEVVSMSERLRHESSRVANASDGWITPAGVFYGCESDEHDELARFLWESQREKILAGITEDIDNLNPRIILKQAGYALLSRGLLAEENLPDRLSAKQLVFISENRLLLVPGSSRWNSFSLNVVSFREGKAIFDALTQGDRDEIVLHKSSGDMILWRQLMLPSGEEKFVQYHLHIHQGVFSSREKKASFSLVTKAEVKSFIDEIKKWTKDFRLQGEGLLEG